MADATLQLTGEDGADSVEITIIGRDDARSMGAADYARDAADLESALAEALPEDTYMRLLALMAINASEDASPRTDSFSSHRARVRYCTEVGARVAELVATFDEHPERDY